MAFSNGLSRAEAERLAILLEEMGEVAQIVGKILRHGYESVNPLKLDDPNNRALLERELGDIRAAVTMMVWSGDVSDDEIEIEADNKLHRVGRYLHHQPEKLRKQIAEGLPDPGLAERP